MAVPPDNTSMTTLNHLQSLINNFIVMLDNESKIAEDTRLLSSDNIDGINETISNALDAMNGILNPV